MLNNNSNCICIYIFNENCKQKSMSAKIYQHFKSFKSVSKLTAFVVNCCKCLQQWSKFLQVPSTACKCLRDEIPSECLQNETPTESFKCITSTKASKQQENSAQIHHHFKTFKSMSKLTACVVNCCKCLQQWSKFLQVPASACRMKHLQNACRMKYLQSLSNALL